MIWNLYLKVSKDIKLYLDDTISQWLKYYLIKDILMPGDLSMKHKLQWISLDKF